MQNSRFRHSSTAGRPSMIMGYHLPAPLMPLACAGTIASETPGNTMGIRILSEETRARGMTPGPSLHPLANLHPGAHRGRQRLIPQADHTSAQSCRSLMETVDTGKVPQGRPEMSVNSESLDCRPGNLAWSLQGTLPVMAGVAVLGFFKAIQSDL